MIGNTNSKIQNETSFLNPRSPYAISKVFAHHITKNYREAYGIFLPVLVFYLITSLL